MHYFRRRYCPFQQAALHARVVIGSFVVLRGTPHNNDADAGWTSDAKHSDGSMVELWWRIPGLSPRVHVRAERVCVPLLNVVVTDKWARRRIAGMVCGLYYVDGD